MNVDLKDFQKPFFVVTGQVAKPGQYDLRYDTTASEAIAVAGGLCRPRRPSSHFPSRVVRLDGSKEVQFERHPERKECKRRCGGSAWRHDFCAGEIHYKFPKIRSLFTIGLYTLRSIQQRYRRDAV